MMRRTASISWLAAIALAVTVISGTAQAQTCGSCLPHGFGCECPGVVDPQCQFTNCFADPNTCIFDVGDGTACDDGDEFTIDDQCVSGHCAGNGTGLLSNLEFKCQLAASKQSVGFVQKATGCAQQCESRARKGKISFATCNPPFTDSMEACVDDAADKATERFFGGCVNDCPECYSGGDCGAQVGGAEMFLRSSVESLVSQVWCEETADKARAKCMDTVGKELAKFIMCKNKCYDRCNGDILHGDIPAGDCQPPSPVDEDTDTCLTDEAKGCEAKAAAKIDKVCADVVDATPACHSSYPTGDSWVAAVSSIIDPAIADTYCGD